MRIYNLLGLVAAGVISAACGGGNDENRSPSAIVIVSGNNQNGNAGTALALPITVQVNDKKGDALKGADVTFAVTGGGGSVQTATVTTNSSGQAATSWTVGTAVGVANNATAAVSGVTTPATFNASVLAGAVSGVTVVSGDAQAGPVGGALTNPVVVEAHDAFNNVVAGAVVTWTPSGGSVQNASVTTNGQGQASATWTLGLTFGTPYSLTANVGGQNGIASASATLVGTTLAVFTGNNQTGAAGAALQAPLFVRVRTPTSQNVTGAPVTWAVATGGGNVTTADNSTDPNGVASVGFTLGAGAGAQTVTASNAATTPTSVTFTANAVVLAPSTIVGSVTASNALSSTSAGRIAASRTMSAGGRSTQAVRGTTTAFPAFTRVRNTRDAARYVPDELIVQFKRQAVSAPLGVRSMANMATAQAVGQAMRQSLSRYAVPGRVTVAGVSPVILMARLKLSDPTRLDSVAQALAQDPAVLSVGRNGWLRSDAGPARPGVIPNDPFYRVQAWNYSMVDLPRSWATTTGSSNIIVAVLDNGAVFFHPSVGAVGATSATGGGNYRNDGYDFVSVSNTTLCAAQGGTVITNNGDGDGYDPDPSTPDDRDPDANGAPCGRSQLGSHSTHVAGTIGATGNDGVGVVGVNWSVGIRPVRVLGIDGGSYFDIAQGVLYASGLPADNGAGGVVTPPAQPARIINMSLGGGCTAGPDPLHAAIQTVTNPGLPNGGVLVVVSAGNDGSSTAPCPAAYDEVIAVGALGPSRHRAVYSNFGSFVDIAAPGGDFGNPQIASSGILSSTCDFRNFPAACTPNHAFYVGTSMASPHVAGAAALLLAATPGLTPADLRARLINYATPLDPAEGLGTGVLNVRNSLTQTMEPPHQILVRAINSTTGAVAGSVTATGTNFTIPALPDGSYFVVAGEDDNSDGQAGLPGRRLGAFGGISSPTGVAVSTTAGGIANVTMGFPVEEEVNDVAGQASQLVVDGAVQGSLSTTDQFDFYKVVIPTAGTYTFETTGLNGAYCGWALDLDTVMDLMDQGQTILDSSVDIDEPGFNYCSKISRSLTPGTYFIRISRDVGSVGPYLLQARTGP